MSADKRRLPARLLRQYLRSAQLVGEHSDVHDASHRSAQHRPWSDAESGGSRHVRLDGERRLPLPAVFLRRRHVLRHRRLHPAHDEHKHGRRPQVLTPPCTVFVLVQPIKINFIYSCSATRYD